MALEVEQPDGATLRQHLEVVARATGRIPSQLDIEPLPDCVSALWEAFCELRAVAGGNGFSANPIGYGSVRDYMSVAGVSLTSWEVDSILAMDRVAIDLFDRQSKQRNRDNGRN